MFNKLSPTWFLVAGILLIIGGHLIISIDLSGWVYYTPFLIYLWRTQGLASRLWLVLALVIGWSISIAKITTPPIPPVFIFLFSVPVVLFHIPAFLIWDKLKSRAGSLLLFPAILTVMEWIQYTFTPFASWGAAAYSQSHSLALMQSVSLFGLPGLSFLVYWVNAATADLVVHRKISKWNLTIPVSLVALFFLFGSLRYDISKAHGKKTMMVAAIGTDSDVGGFPLPSKESNDKVIADMILRTGRAAALGAKLISWTEGATFVLPEDEPGWTQRVSHLSDSLNIYLVASYIKPISEKPMRYENKFLFLNPEGQLLGTYYKHEPVPAEPAVKGKAALEVYDVAGSKVGGVICYDYDFPYLAKGYGRLHADIVTDPSSDWRGIDPLHTRMAAYRAIEQGHSILRSTRFGLSAAITPFGEFTAQMSSFDQNDKIMIGYLPVKGVRTLYSIIGDLLIYISIGFILFSLVRPGMKKQPDPLLDARMGC